MSDKRASRRAFLKYAGSGLVALAGAAASTYYLTKPEPSSPSTTRTQTSTVRETSTATTVLPELRVLYTPDENASLAELVIPKNQLFQPSVLVSGAVPPVTITWYIDDYVNRDPSPNSRGCG